MQEHTRQEKHGKYADRYPGAAREDEKDRLDLAVQKPLEEYQRHEGKDEPEQTGEHSTGG